MEFPCFSTTYFPFLHTKKITEPYVSTLYVRQYKSFQSRDMLECAENFSPNTGILNLSGKTVNSNVINTSLNSPIVSRGSERMTIE